MVAVETLDRYADECLSFSDWWESMEASMLESRMFCKGKGEKSMMWKSAELVLQSISLVIRKLAIVSKKTFSFIDLFHANDSR